MSADDILKILDSIPTYIVYIYPGYLTIYVYNFLKAFTVNDCKGIVFKSVAISFFYKICVDKLPIYSDLYYHSVMVFISILVPYVCFLIQKSNVVLEWFEFFDINTRFETNEIDILDNGIYSAKVRVYLTNENIVYEGYLGEKELEPNKRQFITLRQFKKYTLDENGFPKEPYIEDHNHDEDKVLLFYEKINRIEKIQREIEEEHE